jgi:hypothetical protein
LSIYITDIYFNLIFESENVSTKCFLKRRTDKCPNKLITLSITNDISSDFYQIDEVSSVTASKFIETLISSFFIKDRNTIYHYFPFLNLSKFN